MGLGIGLGLNKSIKPLGVTFSNDFSMGFDGVDDYVDVNSAKGVINTSEGTVSCWVRLDSDTATTRVFSAITDSSNQLEVLWIGAQNYIRFKYKAGGTTKSVNTQVLSDNGATWYHIAAVWSSSSDFVKIYLNGSEETSLSSIGTWSGTVAYMFVGAKGDSTPANFFDGLIDEPALYNTALSAAAISTIYNSGVPNSVDDTNLVGYWRFENNTDDSSSNSNSAILQNGATYNATTP
jgi:hypothetical protein